VRPSGEPLSVAYDATRITTVIAQLSQRPPTMLVGETPGAVERLLLRELVAAALPVIVVHPRQVLACAKATASWRRRTRWMPRWWPALRKASGRPCE
jgi:hypothetical protein